MQNIPAGLQTEFEKTGSTPERVFEFKSVNKSNQVITWVSISRKADVVSSGNVSINVQNSDQSWNTILSSPAGNLLGTGEMKIGYTAISFMTLFKGKLESADFKDEEIATLNFKDSLYYFTTKKIGSSQTPANYYSAIGYDGQDWSSGRNPADLVWTILTDWGGLDNTQSAANTDIDWDAFVEYKSYFTSFNILVQANFQGETIANALRDLSELCLSTYYSEADGKIICRLWMGQDTASIQSYDDSKWEDLPSNEIDRSEIINRYEVSYGLTFPVRDTGTASSGSSTTLVDTGKTWTTDEYKSMVVNITGGTGAGQSRRIDSNTADTLTIAFAWGTNPDGTSTYEIVDISNGSFAGSVTHEDATSKSNYGTFDQSFDKMNIWHYDSGSASGFATRALADTKDPAQIVEFKSFLLAYRQQLFDALKLTESFYSWSDQGFRIEELNYNLNEGTVGIRGRLVSLYHFLILDDPVYGQLDSINVLA